MQSPEHYDMFDVASGECHFSEYLVQRFNTMDLQTRITLDPNDKVEEHLAPRPVPKAPPPAPAPPPPPEPQVSEPEVDKAELADLIANFHKAAAAYNERND